ncbi:VanZ like family protein [Amphibacillus marinus]|uniref:VanZ like family protein n=1 Tax=Amphibacillus marinus TaxID=872970 RepID=A0A1H8QXJ2_9BACI|nr:VanZ family protein [Amphibacillus marinus]SEO58776.1 VanZ like family protein [Amphibacillus marinus]
MRKKIYWCAPISWMLFIFYSSAQPYQNQDVRPALDRYLNLQIIEPYVASVQFMYNQSEVSVAALGLNGFVEFFIRKGAHVFVFFMLTCLFYLALSKNAPATFGRNLSLSVLLTIGYAVLDEWHQSFTPNRTAFWGDVVIDGIGALIAMLVILFIHKLRQRKLN